LQADATSAVSVALGAGVEEVEDDAVELSGAAQALLDGVSVVVLRTMAARAPTPGIGTPSGTVNGVPSAQTALSDDEMMELQQYEGRVFVIPYNTIEHPASGLARWGKSVGKFVKAEHLWREGAHWRTCLAVLRAVGRLPARIGTGATTEHAGYGAQAQAIRHADSCMMAAVAGRAVGARYPPVRRVSIRPVTLGALSLSGYQSERQLEEEENPWSRTSC
jgi:hypothetical protein